MWGGTCSPAPAQPLSSRTWPLLPPPTSTGASGSGFRVTRRPAAFLCVQPKSVQPRKHTQNPPCSHPSLLRLHPHPAPNLGSLDQQHSVLCPMAGLLSSPPPQSVLPTSEGTYEHLSQVRMPPQPPSSGIKVIPAAHKGLHEHSSPPCPTSPTLPHFALFQPNGPPQCSSNILGSPRSLP